MLNNNYGQIRITTTLMALAYLSPNSNYSPSRSLYPQLGRMLGELDDIGMLDNTLVVLASDNGGCPADGGSNFPFRGFKHTLFEGGVRTPSFVYSKSDSIIPAEVSKVVIHNAILDHVRRDELSAKTLTFIVLF